MILEGIVITTSLTGAVNVAPMGPNVPEGDPSAALERFVLRPFRTAQTCANLRQRPEGVLHVTDDVLLLARAAVGLLAAPRLFPAQRVNGWVLAEACRWYEFRITACDDREERVCFEAEVVHAGRLRDFFGFNRAKHAVVEAAILATRLHILPRPEVLAEYARLAVPVAKTGGPQEREAFALLEQYVSSQ
jgi:hypothetical protein